jgi:hypothetical protein
MRRGLRPSGHIPAGFSEAPSKAFEGGGILGPQEGLPPVWSLNEETPPVRGFSAQGRQDSNLEPPVLQTGGFRFNRTA